MHSFRLFFSSDISAAVEVEAEDLDAALELAANKIPNFPYIKGITPPDDWQSNDDYYVDGVYQAPPTPKAVSLVPPADPDWHPAAARWFRDLVAAVPASAVTSSVVWKVGSVASDMSWLLRQHAGGHERDQALADRVQVRRAELETWADDVTPEGTRK